MRKPSISIAASVSFFIFFLLVERSKISGIPRHRRAASPITVKILQLTDFHYDADYSKFGNTEAACHGNTSQTNIGSYGNYACDSPLTLVEKAVAGAAKALENPDFILWTGDNVPHIDNYTTNYVIEALATTTKIISQTFPRTPVLPVLGNHDYAPSNDFPDRNNEIYNSTFKAWSEAGWLTPSQEETFLRGGYYSYQEANLLNATKQQGSGNATFLVLNTNLYYVFDNAEFSNIDDPAGQFEFMENVLQMCKSEGRIANIIAHIPPGAFERTPNFIWMTDAYNKRLIQIIQKYSTTIKWLIFGHHHTDTFKILRNAENTPTHVMFMSPSVTPWFSSLDGAGANNPAFRIYEYDGATYDFTDIVTYSINLTQLNAKNNVQFSMEYSMMKDYGIQNVNAPTMSSLVQKMKVDDELFGRYIKFNSVGWDAKTPIGVFRQAQFCTIENPDLDDYRRCMGSSASKITVMNSIGFVLLLFLCL